MFHGEKFHDSLASLDTAHTTFKRKYNSNPITQAKKGHGVFCKLSLRLQVKTQGQVEKKYLLKF